MIVLYKLLVVFSAAYLLCLNKQGLRETFDWPINRDKDSKSSKVTEGYVTQVNVFLDDKGNLTKGVIDHYDEQDKSIHPFVAMKMMARH